ncbi:MAG: sialidase family protein [Bacteroidales bacterium]|nr:sialidase family protein [Bacteroidales bacterium]
MRKILIILFAVISLSAYSQKDKMQIEKTPLDFKNLFYTTTDDSVSCYRILSIDSAPNGDLKWNNDINIVIRRSSDNG